VYNAPERKYSATASERTLCLIIVKSNFAKFLSTKQGLERALMRTTKRFLLQRYAAMNVPIFGHMREELLTEAANLATFEHFAPGDVIHRQGDAPKAFYVVLHGEVKMSTVVRTDDDSGRGDEAGRNVDGSFARETKRIAASMMSETSERVLTVGQHFGEVGVLLPQTPCIATCTAIAQCSLLTLQSSSFIEIFGQDANLMAEMQIKLLGSECTLKSVLSHKRSRPLFVAHIEGEYSGESIHFYDAVQECLTSSSALDDESMRKKLHEIIAEYVVDNSPQQVNIPGGQQKDIVASKDGPVDVLLKKIKVAQGEIYLLMARDNFPRFTKAQPFLDFMQDIGSYGASVKDVVAESDLTMLVQDGEGADHSLGA